MRTFLIALFSNMLFNIFWDVYYPKVGIEWHKYVAMAIFFSLAILASLYWERKKQSLAKQHRDAGDRASRQDR